MVDKLGLICGILRVLSAFAIGGLIVGVIHLIFKKYDK